jgi:hypothetical protein
VIDHRNLPNLEGHLPTVADRIRVNLRMVEIGRKDKVAVRRDAQQDQQQAVPSLPYQILNKIAKRL